MKCNFINASRFFFPKGIFEWLRELTILCINYKSLFELHRNPFIIFFFVVVDFSVVMR